MLEAKVTEIISLQYGANHSLVSPMWEIRKSGSEWGKPMSCSYLYLENYARLTSGCKDRQGPRRTHQS